MTESILFHFESNEIRFVGDADSPEWIASDICNVLGILNVSDTLSGFPSRFKGIVSIDTLGGKQELATVKEPGLYRLIMRSRKPVAERFQIWLFEEVLPSIRKTGSYSLESARAELEKKFLPTPTLKDIAEVAKTLKAAGFKPSYIERITILNIQRHRPELLPEAPQPQELASLPTVKALMTPTQLADSLGWYCKSNAAKGDPRKVNAVLATLGYQEKIGKDWNPTDKAITANLADRKPVMIDGKKSNVDQLLWSADILPILQEHSEVAS